MEESLETYFSDNDYLRNSTAESMGISRARLAYLVKSGELQRVAQGVYARADCLVDDLAIIASRSSRIVFSHETALSLNQLHNRVPEMPSITLPHGTNPPRSIAGAVKVYYVRPEVLDMGKTEIRSFIGQMVPCYNSERTICDIIHSYSRVDVETYANAIRTYSGLRNKDLPLLMEYARRIGIESKVRKVFEVLI